MIEETHSPQTHALVYEMIKVQSDPSVPYKEGLYREYTAQMAFWESNEFREGTRAKLVDRDHNPRWKHKSVDLVTMEDVDFFLKYPMKETIDEVYSLDKYCYWNDELYKPFTFNN